MMKKNLVMATLLMTTIVSAAAPALAATIGIGRIRVEIGNGRRDHGPDRRDDRHNDYRPPGGTTRVEVQNISDRGEWLRLNLSSIADLSSVEVRGIGGDVRVREAKVYLANGGRYDVSARGSVVFLRGREGVAFVDVWVESRQDRRDRGGRWDRRDRWDRGVDAEITVESDSGRPFVRVSRF